jgi:DNA polymerase I
MNRPVLLVDGLNFFMQHFVVNPTMSTHGNHVGGVVGFMKGLGRLVDRIGPSEVVVAWEGGGSSRRRAIFKDYKGGRRPQKLNRYYEGEIPDTIQNRDDEISMLISLLRHTPVRQIYVPDCEADDVIGYLARYKYKKKRIVIASSDKDLYQLLSKRVIQWSPGQKAFITLQTVQQKFNIHVNNFCTARAFIGDPSDNLKGIPRAGFATLAKRFPELSESADVSIEDIIKKSENILEKSSLKIYTNIVDSKDIAIRNWRLMYLDTQNLAAVQIQKINDALEEKAETLEKIKLIRDMMKYGINNFDADTFFASLRAMTRRN